MDENIKEMVLGMDKKRRRRATDSEVERIVDMIYSDVCEMILDWKTYHAIKRHGATPVDYSYHRAGTMKYGESIVEAITEELLGRIIIDGELNETTYLEEF